MEEGGRQEAEGRKQWNARAREVMEVHFLLY